MSHSINHQFVHLVWSTKDLYPFLVGDSLKAILAYMTGILKNLGGHLLTSSGTSNHVHLLINLPVDFSISKLVCQLKACSSKWYHETDNTHSGFSWNEGYSAFTVSPSSVGNVIQYIAFEDHRHKNRSFEDELTDFLKIQGIEYNPKFLTNTTYTRLIYHLVWSVKNREPLLNASMQMPIHQCIRKKIQENGSNLHAIGNVMDHIHLLVECTNNTSIASLVQNLKTTTTHLIKSQDKKHFSFSWQEGYGVFSVGKPAFEVVSNYVHNQESHHNTKTFDQEWNWFKGMYVMA